MSKSREELLSYAEARIEVKNDSVLEQDCDIIEYMLDNCEITVSENNRFFAEVNCENIINHICYKRTLKYDRLLKENGLADGNEALAYTGYADFSHTVPEWESVMTLGVFGLRERLKEYAEKSTDIKKKFYYTNALRVYNAALRFMCRAASVAAACGKSEMATGLINLTKSKPTNLFEAMQTAIVFYSLQHFFEGTNLRSLGRLDTLFYAFYINENKQDGEKLVFDFLKEIDRLRAPSNIPFMIGGTDKDGQSTVNELSYLLLETYRKAETDNTKFHILCADNTPADLILKGLDAVRNGNNSIVFMSDSKIIESLIKLGAECDRAINYHVVGCYECGAEGELTCSCNARVNLPKALEVTLNNGVDILTGKRIGIENNADFETFEDLYKAVEEQIKYFCDCAIKSTDLYEEQYKKLHCAPFLSSTYTYAVETGGDLYCDYAAKYNNSSVNAIGLATLTDSLYAIKKLVFEEKRFTLREFNKILKADWQNNEPLRLHIKNNVKKFGMGEHEVDTIAKEIVDLLAKQISRRPNKKGGVYRLGLFSINWRWDLGEKTAATAGGRKAFETLSQNASASFGADKNGATAHLLSIANIDASNTPNGTIADIDMHISAVSGENGLNALYSTLKSYFALGGMAVHYNILNTEILKDAKLYPEKYPNLQVRLCGWNVLFSSLTEKEKDEFIARSIK